ncbi:MFS general substrate transporter [Paxillus ammoniavirescens]|nr:MFS general substrate transporter [Paxillus ammoniavirescens]
MSSIRRGSNRPHVRRARLALICFSIGANAICAGGIFCFPLISPALATHLKLTQPQLTTIALAGMSGQYPFAALVGKIVDYYGPWVCSLVAACFFSTGFGLFAWEITNTSGEITQPPTSLFYHLALYFFVSALGTVFSYFSSVFAASKNFPDYIGVSAGTSMALFGLSPTFLSILASRYFTSPDNELDVTHFLQFLAILCGCVHLLGGLTLHVIPPTSEDVATVAAPSDNPEEPDERTSLLPNKTNGNGQIEVQVDVVPDVVEEPKAKQSTLDVLKDRNFWALAFVVFVVLGTCEMIISNIGTIVLSLPRQTSVMPSLTEPPSTSHTTATQVRMLSIANTLSRLLVGPLADIVSPSGAQEGTRGSMRKHLISRMAFLTFSAAVLVCSCAWMVVGVRDQTGVWALSIGAGITYGCTFTVLPSLVSSVWGLSNLGRNFGIITYAPFLGTPVFSYLYAFVAAAHSPAIEGGTGGVEDGTAELCMGPQCWLLTFEVSAVVTTAAFGVTLYLWRVWKEKV